VAAEIFRKRADHQFPLQPPGIFLKEPEIAHQKGGVMFPVRPRQGRKKLRRQGSKDTGRHGITIAAEGALSQAQGYQKIIPKDIIEEKIGGCFSRRYDPSLPKQKFYAIL
jgi:hypothetical protein